MNKRWSVYFLFNLLTISLMFGREVLPFNEGWLFKKAENFPKELNDRWESVRIPHTWNAEDMQTKKNDFYAGEAFYKKSFTPDDHWTGKRVFLRFEGVASVAEVYLNGSLAGKHQGGYSAFAIEITSLLKFGQTNELSVKVSNEARPDVIPINHTLFGVYGGMYRPVELIVTEKVNIAVTDYASPGVYIRQQKVDKEKADISLKIKLENKNAEAVAVRIITTIYEANGAVKTRRIMPATVLPQGRQTFVQNMTLKKPHLWQGLEDPYLYKTAIQIESKGTVIDEIVQILGVRHFELKAGEGMFLNSKKTPMYGVCRHQEWWQYGSALSNEQHDADLEIIREIGATTIRLAHYQQAERMYSQCDSMGFIVWAEIPFVNRVSTQEAANAKQQLTELIRQNYNHPSIYVWGLHNEVYSPSDYTIALTTELNDLAKSEDPDRYTVSVNGHSAVNQTVNLNADIQGINRYYGWYDGKIEDLNQWITGMETDYSGYKIMLAEYGAEANIDQQEENPGDRGRFFSQFYPETFSTKFHEIQWGILSKQSYLLASYIWNTFDFATPVNTQGGVEARNMKGLVTFDRKVKKDAFYWYKANWSKEPVLYLTQRRMTERSTDSTSVTVYSNIGTPTLVVNGEEIKQFIQGTTDVQYIFPHIQLKEGDNRIETTALHQGKQLKDAVLWQYIPKNRSEEKPAPVRENKTEHIGL
ncbi:MAG: beta-galactosidase [Candidatus Symbiothrix sp.]|jgi:beta-galactosidase|nr:beta-galactosidase [Candidatus Symbiothrix sp.]